MKMKFARGKDCRVFSDNIFDHQWHDTGEVTIQKNPMQNTKVEVKWYTVDYEDGPQKFGCAVVGPDYYMFLIP